MATTQENLHNSTTENNGHNLPGNSDFSVDKENQPNLAQANFAKAQAHLAKANASFAKANRTPLAEVKGGNVPNFGSDNLKKNSMNEPIKEKTGSDQRAQTREQNRRVQRNLTQTLVNKGMGIPSSGTDPVKFVNGQKNSKGAFHGSSKQVYAPSQKQSMATTKASEAISLI